MTQQTEIHSLAGAYALDALTEIERAAFARHVAQCESCAVEVAELTETSSRLAVPAWEVPPARLREAVFAEVARTRQVSTSRPDRSMHEARTWRRWTAAAVAAGVVAIGGMGAVYAIQEQRVGDAQQAAQQLRDAQTQLGVIMQAPDAEVHTSSVGGGTVTVAVSRSLDDGVILMDNLPAPPDGKVYQLWAIKGGSARSVGVMETGQRSGAATVDALGGADQIGVSVEPTGGSPKPTVVVAGVRI